MDLAKPAILLVGGGEGMGPVEATVDGVAQVLRRRQGLGTGAAGCVCEACSCWRASRNRLLQCPPCPSRTARRPTLPANPALQPRPPQHVGADCQLVVICGRNAKLVERLQAKCAAWHGALAPGLLALPLARARSPLPLRMALAAGACCAA